MVPPPELAADCAQFERHDARWKAGRDAVMRMGPASAAGSAPKAGAASCDEFSDISSIGGLNRLIADLDEVATSEPEETAAIEGALPVEDEPSYGSEALIKAFCFITQSCFVLFSCLLQSSACCSFCAVSCVHVFVFPQFVVHVS
jgi:hypothetical protein